MKFIIDQDEKKIRIWDAVLQKKGKNAERK